MTMKTVFGMTLCALLILGTNSARAQQRPLRHDAEHYVLLRQHAERWSQEDREIDAKLASVRASNRGRPPNIVYILLDDLGFGEIGMPAL
ncbi:unnamed protein product, partial [marine sediment metagenome]